MRSKRNVRPLTKYVYVIVMIHCFPATELSVKQYLWPVLTTVFLYPRLFIPYQLQMEICIKILFGGHFPPVLSTIGNYLNKRIATFSSKCPMFPYSLF